MGSYPNIGPTPSLLLFITSYCILVASVGASECRVQLCSRQYARALDEDRVEQGPSHRYCSVLRSYGDCVRATARSCRGDLAYHSVQSLVAQWTRLYDCARLLERGPGAEKPPRAPAQRKPHGECGTYRMAGGAPAHFSHCALFGDPHLRTFYDELQTCSVPGAWPLLDNPHVAVQVTNEPVGKGSPATAITKITVIIRQYGPCAQEKTYEAQSDYLPGVFTDGSKWSGPGVRIREESPDRHVEIHLRYIATRIVIRQVGQYLTFAAKMPTAVATQKDAMDTLELCVRGCPRRERIDYDRLLESDSEPKRKAIAECRALNVTDFYFDACVFDLLTTGDGSFSAAARDAMLDAGQQSIMNNSLPVRGMGSGQAIQKCSILFLYILFGCTLLTEYWVKR